MQNTGVASSIPPRSHTFVEIDHEIIYTAILLPSADSRRAVVSYKRKYVHDVLVNRPGKMWLGMLPDISIAVDSVVKHQTKQPIKTNVEQV